MTIFDKCSHAPYDRCARHLKIPYMLYAYDFDRDIS